MPKKPVCTTRAFVAGAIASLLVLAAQASIAAETSLQRGTYLMNSIVACGNCHTPKGPNGKAIEGKELSGGDPIDAPVFHAVPSNITPDKATGIGNWTDDQIINAIRNGKRPDGTTIGPPMPIAFYRDMSDDDVQAIVRICAKSNSEPWTGKTLPVGTSRSASISRRPSATMCSDASSISVVPTVMYGCCPAPKGSGRGPILCALVRTVRPVSSSE